MQNRKATFFVSIFISTPTPEHGRLKSIVSALSDGEYEFLHLHKMGVFILLNTDRSAAEIDRALNEAVTSEDRRFVCEVGPDWSATGLNKATFWLQNHLMKAPVTAQARDDNPFGAG